MAESRRDLGSTLRGKGRGGLPSFPGGSCCLLLLQIQQAPTVTHFLPQQASSKPCCSPKLFSFQKYKKALSIVEQCHRFLHNWLPKDTTISHLPGDGASPSQLQLFSQLCGRGKAGKDPEDLHHSQICQTERSCLGASEWAATAGSILDSQEKLAVVVYVGFLSEGNKPGPSS